MSFPTGAAIIRNAAFLAALALLGGVTFMAGEAQAQAMWKEAKRWQCDQDPFEAACGGRFERQCRVQEPRKIQSLTFDFDENVVIMDDGIGKSYIPLAARTVDRRNEITTILYGEGGNIVMQYTRGFAVTMSIPVGGGAAALQFYNCLPAPAE